MTVTSTEPKTAPAPSMVRETTSNPGRITARKPGWTESFGAGTGSVRRSAASARPPVSAKTTAAISPAAGLTPIARNVTSGGPVTNTTSSTTDSNANAVCRAAPAGSTAAHRARTSDPNCGTAPLTTAARNHVQTGASVRTATINPATPTTYASRNGRRMRA